MPKIAASLYAIAWEPSKVRACVRERERERESPVVAAQSGIRPPGRQFRFLKVDGGILLLSLGAPKKMCYCSVRRRIGRDETIPFQWDENINCFERKSRDQQKVFLSVQVEAILCGVQLSLQHS